MAPVGSDEDAGPVGRDLGAVKTALADAQGKVAGRERGREPVLRWPRQRTLVEQQSQVGFRDRAAKPIEETPPRKQRRHRRERANSGRTSVSSIVVLSVGPLLSRKGFRPSPARTSSATVARPCMSVRRSARHARGSQGVPGGGRAAHREPGVGPKVRRDGVGQPGGLEQLDLGDALQAVGHVAPHAVGVARIDGPCSRPSEGIGIGEVST